MTKSPYKRASGAIRRNAALIVATAAFIVALVGVPGVTAGGLLVTGKQIKNHSITARDLRKNAVGTKSLAKDAVRSSDIRSGAVLSADIGEGEINTSDIGEGQVTPQDVTMPAPTQCKMGETVSIDPSLAFQQVADLCSFTKADATSIIEATWTGSVLGENGGELSGCVFQLRLDGNAAPGGSGEVFGKGIVSVSSSAAFPGAAPGPHTVSVWARVTVDTSAGNKCTVGPPNAGIGQTTLVNEKVL